MAFSSLLGPPEIYMDEPPKPSKGKTENCSPTFLATANPCLDFFFHVVPDTPPERVVELLASAWKHSPSTALKLICNLRGVRGTGKLDKEGFYTAALWLYKYHPKTLALNVKSFAEFGYLKDLLEILFRILKGLNVRKFAKISRERRSVYWHRGKRIKRIGIHQRMHARVLIKKHCRTADEIESYRYLKPAPKPTLQDWILAKLETLDCGNKQPEDTEGQTDDDEEDAQTEAEDKQKQAEQPVKMEKHNHQRNLRKKKKIDMAKKAILKYATDSKYRFLHDQISDLFANLLTSDLCLMKSGQCNKISLSSKWCPSLDSSYDRSTLICESIARKVFPRSCDPDYEGIEEAHYAYRVRDRLRKQVLVPLRKTLQLPEIYMSSKKWKSLPYKRVASVAMKTYKSLFEEHDETRFRAYLKKVKSGKAKIAAGALLPHEILESADKRGLDEVVELQWERTVGDLLATGKLKNSLAICDVSRSMFGVPMQVCVALGLLVSELSEAPWKRKLITFSANPTLQTIRGDTLLEKKHFVEHMDWGMNTDFQKVFDLILEVAVKGKLSASNMIKRVFVFSDMEFDQASANSWETDYETIQRKFKERGYGSMVPEIIFWNLRDSKATPVTAKERGVALVSGYSKNLLNLFLKGDGVENPEATMEQAISGEEYMQLIVYD